MCKPLNDASENPNKPNLPLCLYTDLTPLHEEYLHNLDAEKS